MEDKFYNILWIDDEYEALTGIKGRAKRHGITLFPFKSLNGGMAELERNYPFYDGVLLDAKIYENEDDERGSEDTINIHKAKDALLQLKKKFEVFVLTGQAEAFDDQTFKKVFTNVYKKGSGEETDRLFIDIRKAADQQEDTQLRHSYRRIFDVCTERYIGEYAAQDVLRLLKLDDELNTELHFNAIRKVVEDLFKAFHKFGLLPSEFVNPNVALNPSSLFLAGKEQYEGTAPIYKQHKHLEETYLPALISNCLRNILATVQDASHRASVDSHVKTLKTPFLLKSTLYQLFDVLIWFKIHVDAKPKTENWIRIESNEETNSIETQELTSGKVININSQKGYAFFEPNGQGVNSIIPPHLVSSHSLTNEMAISVKIEDYTDRSGDLKKRVNFIQLV